MNNKNVNKIVANLSKLLILISFTATNAMAQEWAPDTTDHLELAVASVIIEAKAEDAGLAEWFDTAYAYAVFPKVGKGGFGIGGARGKGLVIRGDETIGETTLTQITIGFQLGGQIYAEFIMFKDQVAFENFSRGNYEMGAQVSAIALTTGISMDASYDSGVAVFTIAGGGLMYEASVGGQKFSYDAK